MAKTRVKKPHPMAYVSDDLCPRCDSPWRRPGIVLDPNAEAFPEVEMCAMCRYVFPAAGPDAEGRCE